jgi:hypothetical protein
MMFSFSRKPKPTTQPTAPKRKWQRLRFVADNSIAAVGADEIRQGAGFIRWLAAALQSRSNERVRIKTYSDGQIDLMATAFLCGMTEHVLLRRFAARRAETARSAYALFMLGSVFLCLWIWEALHMPFRISRIISAIEFLPFCAVFFLFAFRNAWTNWQLRTMRMGSPGAYLRTIDSFLPH